MSVVSLIRNSASGLLIARGLPGATGAAGPAGADGAQGLQGAPGANGADGKTILHGTGAPSANSGQDGDFYLDLSTSRLYGPKNADDWGDGVSLIGPTGANGVDGVDGVDGLPGVSDVFTAEANGLAPASGGGTDNFLRADGSWAAPGGGVSGQITVDGMTVRDSAAIATSGNKWQTLQAELTTTNATDVAAITIPLAEGEGVMVQFGGVGIKADGSGIGARRILFCGRRPAGGSASVTNVSSQGAQSDSLTGSISVSAEASGNNVLCMVRGELSSAYQWMCHAEVLHVRAS
jgi:hypothetical protein